MKRIFNGLLLLAVCVMLSLTGKADAANAMLLPVVNNVGREEIESIYYNKVVEALKNHPEIELMDDDITEKIVKKYDLGSKIPDKALLEKISGETDADYIISMQIDEMDERFKSTYEDELIELKMTGMISGYNRFEPGKKRFISSKIFVNETKDIAQIVRGDFSLQAWGHSVTAATNRIIHNKKINFYSQKPSLK